jgi:hypothetical protein
MNMDKVEGLLIGIGAGIVLAAFMQAYEKLRKKPVGAGIGGGPAENSGREGALAQPQSQRVRASHA